MYEMIAGHLPVEGHFPQAIIYSILNVHPDRLSVVRPGVPDDIEEVVKRLLAKSPDERYESAEHVLVALEELELEK